MVWFIFAIFGAFLDATSNVLNKKYLKNIDKYVLGSGIFLFTFLILFIFSLFKGLPGINIKLFYFVLATGLLNLIASIFYYKALKTTDLSLAIPMISFTPVFLIFTSFLLLGELPNIYGMIGIFVIVVGSYLLYYTKENKGFLRPFKEIFKNKGIFFMLIVAFLYSISSNFDKLVVLNSDPIFGSSMVYLFLGISFLIISKTKKLEIKETYKRNFPKFLLAGFILASIAFFMNLALTLQIVPYVISIKRLSILFSIFYGGLIFKEKNILKRSLAALIMVIGVVLIVLS